MWSANRVDTEVGPLRTVLLHRPGAELKRITPRNNDKLLFDGIPWVGRAQEEHDMFARALRERGVEVLYLTQLLQDTLEFAEAREEAVAAVLEDPTLGDQLRSAVAEYLRALHTEDLARVLVAGVAHDELKAGSGLVYRLAHREDFVIDPLPNLVFTRDSSTWVRDRVAVASFAMRARRRETSLLQVVYEHHPRFRGAERLYSPELEHMEGGDVLLLAPGVVAVGVGERTTPAGVERLARRLFAAGAGHTVLAVPITQQRATMHLDTICTMVDVDTVLMYPPEAHTLTALTVTADDAGGGRENTPTASGEGAELRVSEPRPFLEAAAAAIGVDRLHVIHTGLDPVTAEREQWDDGNNTLAVAPRLAVGYERNIETNARLAEADIEVIRVPGSELGSGRGGPRCMSCPLVREPAAPPSGVAAGR